MNYLLIVLVLFIGCSGITSVHKNEAVTEHKDWDTLVNYYSDKTAENPADRLTAIKLTEARERSSYNHFQKGTELLRNADIKGARYEFISAYSLNPTYKNALNMMSFIETGKKIDNQDFRLNPGIRFTLSNDEEPVFTHEIHDIEETEEDTVVTDVPSLIIMPEDLFIKRGQKASVEISVKNVSDLFSAPFYVHYNPDLLAVEEISEGDFLNSGGKSTVFVKSIDEKKGTIIIGLSRIGNTNGQTGDGIIAKITFSAKNEGRTAITFKKPDFRNAEFQAIPVIQFPATVTVLRE